MTESKEHLSTHIVHVSGGSRILKRGVPVCDLSARRGVWGHAPPGKILISGLLRSFLVYSWGEIAKAG